MSFDLPRWRKVKNRDVCTVVSLRGFGSQPNFPAELQVEDVGKELAADEWCVMKGGEWQIISQYISKHDMVIIYFNHRFFTIFFGIVLHVYLFRIFQQNSCDSQMSELNR